MKPMVEVNPIVSTVNPINNMINEKEDPTMTTNELAAAALKNLIESAETVTETKQINEQNAPVVDKIVAPVSVKGTYVINRINVFHDNEEDREAKGKLFVPAWDQIALPRSAMLDILETNGLSGHLIKVNANIPAEKADDEELCERIRKAKKTLDNIVDKGVMYKGHHYTVAFAGSSDVRNSTFTMMSDEAKLPVLRYILCGMSAGKMRVATNKLLVYLGLTMSASRPFSEVFGKELSIDRVVIVDDFYGKITDKADFVSEENVKLNKVVENEVNLFDGYGMIRDSLTGGKSATLRTTTAGMKIFANAFDFEAWAKVNGCDEVTDMWGVAHKLSDVDLILTKSCFKFASACDDWSVYQRNFNEGGHSFRVCVEEHPLTKKALSYQPLQTLVAGNQEDADFLADRGASVMADYNSVAGVSKLLPAGADAVAKLYPAIVNEPWHRAMAEQTYTGRREKLLGGKVPAMGYCSFLAPDPIAFMQAILGMPIVGCLKAGECCCKANQCEEGSVDVVRFPHLDHAHVILNNVKDASDWMMGPTMYINIKDFTTIRIRADYDGDHVWWSQSHKLIELVRRTNKLLGNIAVDWVAPESEKIQVKQSNINEFIRNNTHGNQIGKYADDFTRFWAHLSNEFEVGGEVSESARMTWSWLTWAGNVLIDAAKHGGANVNAPKYVEKYSKLPLPMFCAHAKADSVHPIADAKYWNSRCALTNGFGDKYAKSVASKVSKQLEVEVDEEFNVYMLMANPRVRQIVGLWNQGTLNYAEHRFVNKGFFNTLASIAGTEYRDLIENSDNVAVKTEWNRERAKLERAALQMWCDEHDVTMSDACDCITRCLFRMNKNGVNKGSHHLFMTYWRVFGDMVLENVKRNLETALCPFSPDEVVDDCIELGSDLESFMEDYIFD